MLEQMFESCGLIATYVGVLLEGEVALLTATMASKMGIFDYSWAIFAAFLGATTQGWFKYLIAKKHGVNLLNKKPKLKARIDKASVWFDKNPMLILVIHRFLFGMTTIVLVLAGLKNISYLKFGIASSIATLLWLLAFGGIGYFCAEMMIENINYVGEYKWFILLALVILVFLIWFFKHRLHYKHCLEPIQ